MRLQLWWQCTGIGLLAYATSAVAVSSDTGPCNGRAGEAEDGGVVVIERPATNGRGVAIEACGLIDAPPEQVWPVVTRCEYFQDFLPSVDSSKLLRREGNVAECETKIDLPFPLSDLHSVTRNEESALDGGGFLRQWSLLRGNYARNEGSWTLLPWPGATGTMLVYNLDIDPDNFIPDFILRRLQSSTAPDVFAAVRGRVEYCADRANATACSDVSGLVPTP